MLSTTKLNKKAGLFYRPLGLCPIIDRIQEGTNLLKE